MAQVITVTSNYYFTHFVLKQLFLTDKIKDVVKEVNNDEEEFNEYIKKYLLESLENAKIEVKDDGDILKHSFDVKILKFKKCSVFYLNMPTPEESGDSYCIGIGMKNGKFRYFTLEMTTYDESYGYVISEDDLDDNYKILKKVTVPSEDTFIEAVRDFTTNDIYEEI